MDTEITKAIEDISYIKTIIDKTKIQVSSLSPVFLVSGVSFLFLYLSKLLLSLVIRKAAPTVVIDVVYLVAWVVLIACLAILFFRRRPEVRRSGHFCALPIYDLWGAVILLLPVAWRIFHVLLQTVVFRPGFTPMFSSNDLQPYLSGALYFAIACVSLYATGIVFSHKGMRRGAVLLLCGYVLTLLLPTRVAVSTVLISPGKSSLFYLLPPAVYTSVLQPLIYLALGLYFKKISGDENGTA